MAPDAAERAALRRNPKGVLRSGLGDGCLIERHPRGVLKSGTRIRMEESRAQTLAYELQLPVPKVHEASVSDGKGSILMDFADGECLEERWPNMSADEKSSIAQQLRQIVSTMRTAYHNQQYIGACEGLAHVTRMYSVRSGGPFQTEEEFNDFQFDLIGTAPLLIRTTIAQRFQSNHRIVFTHGDLTPRNIIVKDGRISALLDWEFSGWYPEYWEYVKFFELPTSCKDWKHFAGDIFETLYPEELMTSQLLARWQSP